MISENGDESSRRFKLAALGRRDIFTLDDGFVAWELSGIWKDYVPVYCWSFLEMDFSVLNTCRVKLSNRKLFPLNF